MISIFQVCSIDSLATYNFQFVTIYFIKMIFTTQMAFYCSLEKTTETKKRQKRTIGDQEHANNASVSTDQINIVGKVCSECLAKCSPFSNFCTLCGKGFKEI